MNQTTLSLAETAKLLNVRESYVLELIAKDRLNVLSDNRFDAEQVSKLAELLNKLRGNGINALLHAASEGKL